MRTPTNKPSKKYSRDAGNQLDNQGEKADNEDEIITDYAELEKLAADKNNKLNGYYKEVKTRVDKATEPNISALLDNIIQDVSKNFLDLFNESNSPKDTHILLGDRRKSKVLQKWAVYANKFVEKPSNYKETLKRFIPIQALDKLSRERLVDYYNLYRNVAKEMYEYGSYVYGELCEELARGEVKQYNSRDREHVGRSIRRDLNRVLGRSKKSIKFLTEMYGRQALENLNIPKHPHEEQNSRDVSAFSFAGNPLSEEALKAKAEFETPLDELEKVSRERLRKVERNIQDFGKRIGVPVHFVYHLDRGYRGVCIHNGGIYINLNSNVPARRIFMHEFVHWLKASGEDNNKIFTALASVIETKQGTLNEARMNEYRRTLYGDEEMSDSQIIANQSNYLYISTNISKKFIIQLKIIRKQVRFCIFITYLS